MEYRKLKDQDEDGNSAADDLESLRGKPLSVAASLGGGPVDRKWKRKSMVTLALTVLTSSQAILIVWSKRAGKYEYSVTTANFSVEALKCALSLAALARIWNNEGVTDDNRLSTTLDEVIVYPIPAALYLVKNLLQYYIFAYVDAPGYQILKNLNIISTGVLYRIILKRKLSEIQWAAFIILCAGCTTAQLNPSSDHVLQTPLQGWVMAIVMALLSGFAGVYTEAIIKKRPSRNINVQNFWLYVFGMVFNAAAIVIQDFDAVVNKGFFHGYSFITVLMILNHALSGIAVSMVMKYADNIVKVYSTSVAMLLTAVVSVFLFGFHLSLAFFLGSIVVSVSVYLHSIGKGQSEVVTISGYQDVPRNSDQALLKALAHQPISVAIDASDRDFQFYSGGVFNGPCGTQLTHGVTAVGYGTSEGLDYIIVKNSWGPKWGEKGYIRMKRNTGKPEGICGINKLASYPTKKK